MTNGDDIGKAVNGGSDSLEHDWEEYIPDLLRYSVDDAIKEGITFGKLASGVDKMARNRGYGGQRVDVNGIKCYLNRIGLEGELKKAHDKVLKERKNSARNTNSADYVNSGGSVMGGGESREKPVSVEAEPILRDEARRIEEQWARESGQPYSNKGVSGEARENNSYVNSSGQKPEPSGSDIPPPRDLTDEEKKKFFRRKRIVRGLVAGTLGLFLSADILLDSTDWVYEGKGATRMALSYVGSGLGSLWPFGSGGGSSDEGEKPEIKTEDTFDPWAYSLKMDENKAPREEFNPWDYSLKIGKNK